MTDFEQGLQQRLRAGELEVDMESRRGLQAARQRALTASERRGLPRTLWPVGGMTLASLALFFLVISPLPPFTERGNDALSVEAPVDQELDFYYWLAQTQNTSET